MKALFLLITLLLSLNTFADTALIRADCFSKSQKRVNLVVWPPNEYSKHNCIYVSEYTKKRGAKELVLKSEVGVKLPGFKQLVLKREYVNSYNNLEITIFNSSCGKEWLMNKGAGGGGTYNCKTGVCTHSKLKGHTLTYRNVGQDTIKVTRRYFQKDGEGRGKFARTMLYDEGHLRPTRITSYRTWSAGKKSMTKIYENSEFKTRLQYKNEMYWCE